MVEIRLREATLFGDEDLTEVSGGDLYLARILINRWDDARERAAWFMEHLPLTGDMLLYEEDSMVLGEALESFVWGNFSAAVVLSAAFIERLLTDLMLVRGAKRQAKAGLSKIAEHMASKGWVERYIAERILRLHKIRNNFAHERPLGSGSRLFHRAMKWRKPPMVILAEDAKEAVCLAYGLAAQFPRSFPDWGPEATTLYEDVL